MVWFSLTPSKPQAVAQIPGLCMGSGGNLCHKYPHFKLTFPLASLRGLAHSAINTETSIFSSPGKADLICQEHLLPVVFSLVCLVKDLFSSLSFRVHSNLPNVLSFFFLICKRLSLFPWLLPWFIYGSSSLPGLLFSAASFHSSQNGLSEVHSRNHCSST